MRDITDNAKAMPPQESKPSTCNVPLSTQNESPAQNEPSTSNTSASATSIPETASTTALEDSLLKNSARGFIALDAEMIALHRQNTPESRAEAERIAQLLLTYAELPPGIRVRAHILMGKALWSPSICQP